MTKPKLGDVWRHSVTGVCTTVTAVEWPVEDWMPREWRIELSRVGTRPASSVGGVTQWWELGWRPWLRPMEVFRAG